MPTLMLEAPVSADTAAVASLLSSALITDSFRAVTLTAPPAVMVASWM